MVIVSAATFLAGCASVQPGRPAAPAADVAAHQVKGKTPEQRAAISAAAMLAAFIPPPHAVRTGPLPLLPEPGIEPLTGDQVTRTRWWRVASQPQAVLAWIQAHKPPGSTYNGSGGVTRAGRSVLWDVQFDLPPVPGVLPGRELEVTLAADGPGQTGLRADAFVDWQPARSAAETIPASARVVTITPVGSGASDHQVTLAGLAQVAPIAAAVNALPVSPPHDPMWCDVQMPPGGGTRMRLTFRAGTGSPPLAVVTAYQELCGQVTLVLGGKAMPSLTGADTLIQRVMAIAGFRWPDYPAPGPTGTAGP